MEHNQRQFSAAAGARPLDEIDSIDVLPDAVWMAAVQLHEKERVSKNLLLDKELKRLLPPDERKDIKKGILNDDMQIIGTIDGLLERIHDDIKAQEEWEIIKSRYPSSFLDIAIAVNAGNKIDPRKITGDLFMLKGMPKITGDKLHKLRYESHTLDLKTDEHFVAFDNELSFLQANLRMEELRFSRFDRMGTSREALHVWEEEETRESQRKFIDIAMYKAKMELADEQLQKMFVTGPDAKQNQALLGKGVNAAVALSLSLNALGSETSSFPETPTAIAASADYSSAGSASAAISSDSCNTESPMLFDGKQFNFFIDDPKLCGYLTQIVPKKGETVQINDAMSLRSNEDGTYHFRLETEQTRAECLHNAPAKLRQDFFNKTGAESCKETVVNTNTITSRNFQAIVEAALVGAGKDGKAEVFAFLMSKWYLESRHGNLLKSPKSSATGMNQFIRSTWIDEMLRHGHHYGYEDGRNRLLAIAAKMGMDEDEVMSARNIKKLSRDKEVRAMHTSYNLDPTHAAVMGSVFNVKNLIRLQKGIESGRIPHPLGAGHTEVNSKMAYTCQLLGFDGCRAVFIALEKNPDQKIGNIIKGERYSANRPLLEKPIFVRDKDGNPVLKKNGQPKVAKMVKLTVREFLNNLEGYGNTNDPIAGIKGWEGVGVESLAKNQDNSHLQLLRIQEARNYDLRRSIGRSVAMEISGTDGSNSLPPMVRRVHRNIEAIPKSPETQVASATHTPVPAL